MIVVDDQQYPVEVIPKNNGESHEVIHAGCTYQVASDWQFGQPLFQGNVNGTEVNMIVERRNMLYRLLHWGTQLDIMVLTARAAELLACMPKKAPLDTSKFLLSPMPGLLSQLMVSVGSEVKRGQDLAVVEAMKMEKCVTSGTRWHGFQIASRDWRHFGGRSTDLRI